MRILITLTLILNAVAGDEPMNFTFGIITGGGQEAHIKRIISSIEHQNIPNYQIIIIGSCRIRRKNTLVIPFNEAIIPRWVTKKKNLITSLATYENIVFMHDYVALEPGWYSGWLKFGSNYKVALNKIKTVEGERCWDWCLYEANRIPGLEGVIKLLPYDVTHLSKHMYISGAYWVAKKQVMLDYPLDETLCWGQMEDVEWSQRIRETIDFSMNPYSTVKYLKGGKIPLPPMSKEEEAIIRAFTH